MQNGDAAFPEYGPEYGPLSTLKIVPELQSAAALGRFLSWIKSAQLEGRQ